MGSQHRQASKSDPNHVSIPLSGKLVEVLVDPGDVIQKDQAICVIKQMSKYIALSREDLLRAPRHYAL